MSEPAGPDPDSYLLNADAGRRRAVDPESPAAIGPLLRTRQMAEVDHIAEVIGPVTIRWVPRGWNAEADRLVNQTFDALI